MRLDTLKMLWQRPGAAAAVIFVVALIVRLPGLGDFMTADEENWMLRSGTFWHELVRNGNPGGTFMTTHPGATTMWLSGAGIFMQEARLGFDIDTSNLRYFRLAATLPITLATAVLIGLSAWLLFRLFGLVPGPMAALVLAVDPYLVGMSQIVHLDALLALFMLVAVLSIFYGYRHGTRWLLIAGVLAGLALATKFVPALWLFLFLPAFLILSPTPGVKHLVLEKMRVLCFVGGVALLTLYAAWPALWVKDDFFRSFERDVPSVLTQEHVALETSEEPIEPVTFYVRTVLGRTMPFVLILIVGGVAVAMKLWRRDRRAPTVAWLFLYAIGYLVLITFAAKKADRYALPALVMLPVIAGWMFGVGMLSWRRILSPPSSPPVSGWRSEAARFMLGFVVVSLIAHTLLLSPHAIAYNSPLFSNVRQASQQGWGEGLEGAAAWLNQHPLAEKLVVASWYPSVLGTYFNGQTMSLSSRDDARVGFVVLYRNMFGRGSDDVETDVLQEFAGKVPAHTVYIGGKPQAWVFNTIGLHYFSEHAGEIIGSMEIGQTVPVESDNWSSIDIGLATFSSRANTEDVILHIRENPDTADDIRTAVVNAAAIEDGSWQRFAFEPIAGSAGRSFYVALSSPESLAGNAITVWFSQENILPGQLLLRRRALGPREANSDFLRQGDLAYRLP